MSLTKLINDWGAHCVNIGECIQKILETANVPFTTQSFSEPGFIALTLLSRTLSNLKGAMVLLDNDRIVEARTIARCCVENYFWIGGLVFQGDEFVKRMRHNELSQRQATHQVIFQHGLLDEGEELEGRVRTFMRDLNNKNNFKSKTLNAKGVAATAEGLNRYYIIYSMLSSDAAHPSILALTRYVASDQPGGSHFQPEPRVRPEEVEDTYYCLSLACVGVCIGTNELLGGNKGAQMLKQLAERHSALSILSEAGRQH
jgi:hypothetical protein